MANVNINREGKYIKDERNDVYRVAVSGVSRNYRRRAAGTAIGGYSKTNNLRVLELVSQYETQRSTVFFYRIERGG